MCLNPLKYIFLNHSSFRTHSIYCVNDFKIKSIPMKTNHGRRFKGGHRGILDILIFDSRGVFVIRLVF